MTITLDQVADLSDGDREALRALTDAVYPPARADEWHGRDLEWDTPEWCVRVRGEDGGLLSYVGVYLCDAEHDGQGVRIGGIGNVKTHPDARRFGLAGLALRRAADFFAVQVVGFGLLVCEPHLLSYYSRFGWREFDGQLVIRQHGAAADFTMGRVMVLDVASSAPSRGTIDLRGPPW